MRESERHIQAVSAAMDVLMAFDRDAPLRLKELHERTGQSRSRLLRILGTLESRGFIHFNSHDGSYELGSALYRVGWLLHDRAARFDAVVRPILVSLVADTGDTAFISGVEGDRRIVLAAEESSEALRFTAKEGQSRPLHLGASGKVLLAFADSDVREKVLAQVDERDEPRLLADLSDIAAEGFALSRGEVTTHGFAISVPLRGTEGRIYSLSLAGVLSKLSHNLIDQHVSRLVRESRRIEQALLQMAK